MDNVIIPIGVAVGLPHLHFVLLVRDTQLLDVTHIFVVGL